MPNSASLSCDSSALTALFLIASRDKARKITRDHFVRSATIIDALVRKLRSSGKFFRCSSAILS
jgi:hypothetical protein